MYVYNAVLIHLTLNRFPSFSFHFRTIENTPINQNLLIDDFQVSRANENETQREKERTKNNNKNKRKETNKEKNENQISLFHYYII